MVRLTVALLTCDGCSYLWWQSADADAGAAASTPSRGEGREGVPASMSLAPSHLRSIRVGDGRLPAASRYSFGNGALQPLSQVSAPGHPCEGQG